MSFDDFRDFLREKTTDGPMAADAVVAAVVPLLQQVIETHEAGRVAPLEGLDQLHVEGLHLWFEDRRRQWPRQEPERLREIERSRHGFLDIVAEMRETDGEPDGSGLDSVGLEDLHIARPGDEITRPVYLPGYRSWEHHIGHHDGLTDVFSLGLILASLACGLDLDLREDLEKLVASRSNLMAIARGLHPVIAQTIVRMTELDRHRRAQDLPALLRGLTHYRDVDIDVEFDVAQIPGFGQRDRKGRRRAVLARLEERLFEISRRNPLLHFKPRASTLNLTLASVPLSFHPEAIRPESLLIWQSRLQERIAAGKPLQLNSHLRFDEATYLPGTLDKIRLEAGRDKKEIGFSNLRLVVAFLRWHNLKEAPDTRINSPLALLPVELKRKRGVRDRFVLEPLSTALEINPVLKHQLIQLYGIQLPDTLDLETADLDHLFKFLEDQIRSSEPGVSLRKIDRPRIKLIHSQARRTLNHYLRRQRRYGRSRSYMDLDYSYRRDHFQPLGLRLFQNKVRPAESALDLILGAVRPGDRSGEIGGNEISDDKKKSGVVRERQVAAFVEDGETHAYAWEVDLCALTLGNFRYRKMSLVRDYDAVIEEDRANPVFDSLFSVTPRPALEALEPLPLAERYPVLACDPTQASSIDQARRGASYIVQGPPGTGKSQTIANLIADYAARGRKVLFVCQKRAAIDVVFLRLKSLGLDGLCCLIHDAQADKKAVIHELRDTYRHLMEEDGVEEGEGSTRHQSTRQQCLDDLRRALRPLETFDDAMRGVERSGIPVWGLLARLVEMRDLVPVLEPVDKEDLRWYGEWHQHRHRMARLAERIAEVARDSIFSSHSLAALNPRLAAEDRPHQVIDRGFARMTGLAEKIRGVLGELPVDTEAWSTLPLVRQLIAHAKQVEPFASRGLLTLSDPASELSQTLDVDRRKFQTRREAWKDAQHFNQPWTAKLSRGDLESALDIAKALDSRWLPALRPTWWKLRQVLEQSYDWNARQLRPKWLSILEHLADEYIAADALRELGDELGATYGWDDFEKLAGRAEQLREAATSWDVWPKALHQGLLAQPDPRAAQHSLARLPALEVDVDALEGALGEIFADPSKLDLRHLNEVTDQIQDTLGELDDVLPCFAELMELPAPLARAVRERPWTMNQLEAAVAESSLDAVYQGQRSVARFSARARDQRVGELGRFVDAFHRANATFVQEQARGAFRGRMKGQAPREQALKDRYTRGRRELEHEFGKKMRYKSIRDLWSGPAGEVLRDLKPVWLMSPLSISDTLPLTDEHFDVVIFDEASQVPVEEAVPALFRARQVIVVGDEMQLPPTSFFASRSPDDELLLVEDEGDIVEYDLSSNSFLNQACKRLPSTYLGWHYRSRSEALISFSNAAFYRGQLLTVPEEELPREAEEIVVTDPENDAGQGAGALLDRSVSFHFLKKGVYDQRRNAAEADYIAHLVRDLLRRGELGQEERHSLGVVAFSEAQQDEIEVALERLARNDRDFEKLLEAEYEREKDGEHVGLLVKNLENIQGDERDIVILSICYGPAKGGKVRMNFGPINQSGGEKRLNVAFSRAKHHMVVVSSMRHTAIKNVFNDGASSLRNYLRYAESVSKGDFETVGRILKELSTVASGQRRGKMVAHPVIEELTSELEERGYSVDHQVGQSVFRCDLAVYRPGDRIYRLGVLVDTAEHYRQTDILERDLMKPRLLEEFGWKVASVLTKDWYQDRDRVLKRLLQLLKDTNPPGHLER